MFVQVLAEVVRICSKLAAYHINHNQYQNNLDYKWYHQNKILSTPGNHGNAYKAKEIRMLNKSFHSVLCTIVIHYTSSPLYIIPAQRVKYNELTNTSFKWSVLTDKWPMVHFECKLIIWASTSGSVTLHNHRLGSLP